MGQSVCHASRRSGGYIEGILMVVLRRLLSLLMCVWVNGVVCVPCWQAIGRVY